MEDQKPETERTFYEEPSSTDPAPKGNRSILLIIVLAVIVALALGGWFVLKGKTGMVGTPSPSPSPFIEITTAEPAATPTIKRSDVKIEILNGTGISGEAAILKVKLTNLGYSNFEVGNSTRQDNLTTEVSFAASVPAEVKDEIEKELRSTYQSVKVGGSVSGETDIRVVTGLRRGVTPKPTASPTPKPTSSASPTSSPKATSTPTPSPSPSPTG